MTIVLAWLFKNWRLVAYGMAAVVLLWMLMLVRHWHADSLTLPRVVAQAKSDAAKAAQVLESTKAAYRAAQAASEGYQRELQVIASRPVPTTPVRLCRAASSVRPASPATGGPSPVVPAAGVLPAEAGGDIESGPDIGPALRALLREADEVSARGRAIQSLKD